MILADWLKIAAVLGVRAHRLWRLVAILLQLLLLLVLLLIELLDVHLLILRMRLRLVLLRCPTLLDIVEDHVLESFLSVVGVLGAAAGRLGRLLLLACARGDCSGY